jgi:hypothetical protein
VDGLAREIATCHPDRWAWRKRLCRPCGEREKWNTYLRRNYGLSADDYDALLAEQGGVCALCRRQDSTGRRLAVDHDHVTGRIRALVCFNCNTKILPLFDRDREAITRLAAPQSELLNPI